MIVTRGIIRGGRVEVAEPIDLPDGSEVIISGPSGLRPSDEEAPPTPEAIATTLAAMAAIEPLDLTEEEQAAWDAERRERRDWEKARFEKHGEKLRGMWE